MVFILYHFLRFCWKAAISLFIKKTGTAPLGIKQLQAYHLLKLQDVHILSCIATELETWLSVQLAEALDPKFQSRENFYS